MILTGQEIEREWANKRITISPFVPEHVNPNSYNFRLGRTLRVYRDGVLDAREKNAFEEIEITDEGYVLEPGRLYLAHTMEVLGGAHYAPTFAARSSIARLGMFINLSASLGDIGYEGQWTLQLYTLNRIRVYPGICIGQMMWWRPQGDIEPYDGKYQGARGPRSSDIHVDFEKQIARQRLPHLRASVELEEVGPKFASLAEVAHHVPVPTAFCIPAGELAGAVEPAVAQDLSAAFTDLQATVGAFFAESTARIEQAAAALTVPAELARLLEWRVRDLFGTRPDVRFAVRSSGLAEDTQAGSLAGVHETVLGVTPQTLVAAVERCWRSHYAPSAVAARLRSGDLDWRPSLAVIVQEQVSPVISGVAFVGHDGDAVDVEYVEGLADALVAGVAIPERVRSSELGADDGRPHARILHDVVRLARRMHEHVELPVDVEWASDGETTHLIQVRPQTSTAAPTESRTPSFRAVDLYAAELPDGFALAEVAGVYGSYVGKRGPAFRLAQEHGVGIGRGWVCRLNGLALADDATSAEVLALGAGDDTTEYVIDFGEHVRQIVVPRSELLEVLAEHIGPARSTRLHSVVIRRFLRGELGFISRVAGDGMVVEFTPDGLMALNRGTAAASTVAVADRRDLTTSVRCEPGGESLVPHLPEIARFTEAMQERHGDVTLEWVLVDGRPYFVDHSVLGRDVVTVDASGTVLISAGTARGRLLRLDDDELLSRLSVGPAVSIDKPMDVVEHDGLRVLLDRVAACPEPPVIHTSRPYAVLSVLIGHVAGFVFDAGSTLGHLPILLREAGVPAVAAADLPAGAEVVLSDGTLTIIATEEAGA